MDDFLRKKLEEIRKCCMKANIVRLKELGGEIAEKAYLRGDRRLVNLIVISYALAKFFEKHYVKEAKQWGKFYEWFLRRLQDAADALDEGDAEEFYRLTESIVGEIKSLSEEVGRFQSNIVEKARIKAATQIYAHGASLSMAAGFADVEKAALASYINVTKLPEKYGTKSVRERLRMAEEIFGPRK